MTPVNTILHPTDFSPCADAAFHRACALAREHGARIILLHALEPVRLAGECLVVELFSPPKQDRWEQLHRLKDLEHEVRIDPVMRKGTRAEVILAVAREMQCDLIVMSRRNSTIGGATCLCEVVADVSRAASCTVLGVELPGGCDLPPTRPTSFSA